jgi:hypothetical protein
VVVRLESSILHQRATGDYAVPFRPEINFFSQIEGERIYHLYEPTVLGEDEVEPLYVRATTDIGQVTWRVGTPSPSMCFDCDRGQGSMPQNLPHWVETVGSRSISYMFVCESRMSARVRSLSLAYLRAFMSIRRAPASAPHATQ